MSGQAIIVVIIVIVILSSFFGGGNNNSAAVKAKPSHGKAKSRPVLGPGLKRCDKCHGTGSVWETQSVYRNGRHENERYSTVCNKCWGRGTL